MYSSLPGRGDGGAFLIKEAFKPGGLATAIGSFPHQDPDEALDLVFSTIPDIPVWPQLPNRVPEEKMLPQYSEGLPGIVWIPNENRLFFDTELSSFDDSLVEFFERYFAVADSTNLEALESFAISPDYAAGFHAFLDRLRTPTYQVRTQYLKGQVTGPITFGLGVSDQTGRASYYNDSLRQAIVKAMGLKAKWQINKLKEFSEDIIIFIDEPTLTSFGSSALISLSREDVIRDLSDVVETIQAAGALAGVHCCGRTDWSLLFGTNIDILSLDAFDYGESLFFYSDELVNFLSRGGVIAWGIVPTADKVTSESVESLAFRLDGLINKGASPEFSYDDLLAASLITPSCGAGSLSIDLSEKVFHLLFEVSNKIRSV